MARKPPNPRKPKQPLKVRKVPLKDLSSTDKAAAPKGGRGERGTPPYMYY